MTSQSLRNNSTSPGKCSPTFVETQSKTIMQIIKNSPALLPRQIANMAPALRTSAPPSTLATAPLRPYTLRICVQHSHVESLSRTEELAISLSVGTYQCPPIGTYNRNMATRIAHGVGSSSPSPPNSPPPSPPHPPGAAQSLPRRLLVGSFSRYPLSFRYLHTAHVQPS